MKTINGVMLSKMVANASKLLDLHREKIDALNVFPVPDGDTGANMSLTVKSAVKDLKLNNKNVKVPEVCDVVTKGALRGARGNSGVITSQVFRGICLVLAKAQEVDVKVFVKSLKTATDVAYSAVSKPKEGTMLTVCKAMSEGASSSKAKTFEELFKDIIDAGEKALAYTPEQLPVLKKAGVVDSGGMGLLTIFKGMNKAILGEEIESVEEEVTPEQPVEQEHADILSLGAIEFGYCTEFFIINIKKKTTLAAIDRLREYLMTIGDSVIVVGDLDFVKVHVHTNRPGNAISHALELGEVDKVKIENMLEQNRELMKKYEAEKKEIGMLSVCSGKGFEQIFKDVGVDGVVEGGQTMNPSASDIADAIARINASNVFVFPNNKNITLAAEQSKQLVEGKVVHVIPTKNVPQGILAALAFNPEESPSVNKVNMLHAIENVVAGQVTYAVRNSKTDGFTLKNGDIIALNDKKILAKSNDIGDCVIKLVEKLATDSHSVINLYYGADVSEEDAEVICSSVQEKFPSLDVELFFGGQAVYYFVVSLE